MSTGMAVFGWVYMIIAFGPWTKDAIGPPPLLTSALLEYLQDQVVSETPYLVAVPRSNGPDTTYALRGKRAQGRRTGNPAHRSNALLAHRSFARFDHLRHHRCRGGPPHRSTQQKVWNGCRVTGSQVCVAEIGRALPTRNVDD